MIFTIIFTSINYTYGYNLNISAPSAILIESETGRILYEKNINDVRAIASTTKIMTYLLVMEAIEEEKIKLDDSVTISRNAANAGGSSYYLKENEIVTVEELLNSMMIISANDSAVALAEHVSESVENFCNQMNDKAKTLELKSAYFINPNGMPLPNNDQNKMTAKEMALLSKYVINKYGDYLFEITRQKQFNGTYKPYSKRNTNKLLERETFIDGLKTGYTGVAGYCLVSTAKIEGSKRNRFIAVVLGGKSSESRFNDSKKIIEYGLSNFHKKIVVEKGELLGYSEVFCDEYIPIELIAKDGVSVFTSKNIDISKDKELLFESQNFYNEILNGEEIKSILKLNDGTETEITIIANRGIAVFLDNNPIIFEEVNPFIKDNTALVPLRQIVEALGVEIEWDQSTKTITGKRNNTTFTLTIDSKLATLNEELIELSVPAMIAQGKTMVPARFIAESLGMEIKWDNNTRRIKIYSHNNITQGDDLNRYETTF